MYFENGTSGISSFSKLHLNLNYMSALGIILVEIIEIIDKLKWLNSMRFILERLILFYFVSFGCKLLLEANA